MAMEYTNGPMVSNTMGNGNVESAKAKAFGREQPTTIYMSAIGVRIELMDMALTLGLMVLSILSECYR